MGMNQFILHYRCKNKDNSDEIVKVKGFKNWKRKEARNPDDIPGNPCQTVLTTGKVLPAGRYKEEHLSEGNGKHGEIDPCLSDDQQPDKDGRHRGEGDPEKHSQQNRDL